MPSIAPKKHVYKFKGVSDGPGDSVVLPSGVSGELGILANQLYSAVKDTKIVAAGLGIALHPPQKVVDEVLSDTRGMLLPLQKQRFEKEIAAYVSQGKELIAKAAREYKPRLDVTSTGTKDGKSDVSMGGSSTAVPEVQGSHVKEDGCGNSSNGGGGLKDEDWEVIDVEDDWVQV